MGPRRYLSAAVDRFAVDARGHVLLSTYARLWAQADRAGVVGPVSLRALCGGDTGSRKPVSRALTEMEADGVLEVRRPDGRSLDVRLADPRRWSPCGEPVS